MGANLQLMAKLQDEHIAEDVRKKSELGWFDVEFTMYGTAYIAAGEMCYRTSSIADKIYHYMERHETNDCYCGNVLCYSEKCPVPMGMKEEKALNVKKTLAHQLRARYPQALFTLLSEIAEEAREDSAYPLLLQEQQNLEGCFDERRLRYFRELVDYAYGCLKLNSEHHHQFMNWISAELRNMEDDFKDKDIFEKTFYGIVYHQNGKDYYLYDALREYIYTKKYQLEQKGIMTTPLFSETYWYNYTYRIRDAQKDYVQLFHEIMNAAYLEKLQAIRTPNKHYPSAALLEKTANIKNTMGADAADTLLRYAYRWCIL